MRPVLTIRQGVWIPESRLAARSGMTAVIAVAKKNARSLDQASARGVEEITFVAAFNAETTSSPEQGQENDDRNRNPDQPQQNAFAERHARLPQELAFGQTTP